MSLFHPHQRPAWIRHRLTPDTTFHHREDDTYTTDAGTNILSGALVGSMLSAGDDHGFDTSPDISSFSGGSDGGGMGGSDSFSGGGGSDGGAGASASW